MSSSTCRRNADKSFHPPRTLLAFPANRVSQFLEINPPLRAVPSISSFKNFLTDNGINGKCSFILRCLVSQISNSHTKMFQAEFITKFKQVLIQRVGCLSSNY